ncbi:MAG: DNA-directed RNA polymerase subunit alpha [Candidatus Kerfeldbacteria bacterium]|nr:DNA-directed RNA polymerase subunit alpha [Candidatus Kerfeldbacteria bacterium]
MESIPLPRNIVQKTMGPHRSAFTIEPLYPGYGTTLGNTLRRVLLSSLPGAAITAVKIEGINHEFSAIPKVKEDVVDILLNVKQIRLKVHRDEPLTVHLKAKGNKPVTAGDLEKNADLEVVNPKQPIATLTDKTASFEMELTVARGRGYVPVENREKDRLPIGTIAIDAIYTPVKNVNFTTEHVRVEQMTNFDKLILDITTDGSLTPDEALRQAASIMVEHFQFVLTGPTETAAMPTIPDPTSEPEPDATATEKQKKKPSRRKKDDQSAATEET